MATQTANPKIRSVLDRIVDILDDNLDAGDVLNPTGTGRAMQAITRGVPVPGRLAVTQLPAAWVHLSDGIGQAYEYNNVLTDQLGVVVSVLDVLLDKATAYDTVCDYVDEIKLLALRDNRKWKRAADSDLGVVTTLPAGVEGPAPWDEVEDHFIVRADLHLTVVVFNNLY